MYIIKPLKSLKITSIISFLVTKNQLKEKSDIHYFKLPYIGNLSHHIKNTLSKLCKEFCKESFNIKRVFKSFKITNYSSYKDPFPNDLKSFLVYKCTCASCSSSYRYQIQIFLNIYTPLQHALTHIILFVLKYLIKLITY